MVNLRIGTFLYPPYADKDENGQPTGMRVYLRRINFIRSMLARSLSFVYIDGINFGKYENGTYDGLLGLVYNDQADSTVLGCPLETDPLPGKLGPTVYAADVHIYTVVNPSTWQSVDLLSCLNVFNMAINSLIMLALISFGFLLFKFYKRQTFIVLVGNAIKQSFSTVEALGFLPHLSMLMGILFVHVLHGSLYSTNAWIEVGPEKVDTLEDMVIQEKEPIFFKGGPEHLMFKNGFSKDARNIWDRAKRRGLSKCLLAFDQIFQLVSNGGLTPEKAFIHFIYFEAQANVMVCQLYPKRVKEGLRFHISKTVHSGLFASLRNPRLSYSHVQLADNLVYSAYEFGDLEDFRQDYFNNPALDTSTISPDCRRELFKPKTLNDEESDIKLTLKDFRQTLALFFVILIVLSLLFLIEFKRIH